MKIFVVHLKDGKEIEIEAKSYSRDNEQYVFVSEDDTEIQFVVCSEVVSVTEHKQTRRKPGSGF